MNGNEIKDGQSQAEIVARSQNETGATKMIAIGVDTRAYLIEMTMVLIRSSGSASDAKDLQPGAQHAGLWRETSPATLTIARTEEMLLNMSAIDTMQ